MNKKSISGIVTTILISCLVFILGSYLVDKMENKKVASVDFNDAYEIVAGVIRNEGNGWGLIQDDNHETIGISEITQDDEKVVIKYSKKSKVNSMAATVDETMAKEGYTVGASVGIGETWLLIFDKNGNQVNPKDYVNASGNIWIQGIFKK